MFHSFIVVHYSLLCSTAGQVLVQPQFAFECLVGSEDLVDPTAELGDAGVDGGGGGGAAAASPGHNTDQSPGVVLLTDQRATRVTLRDTQRHDTINTT